MSITKLPRIEGAGLKEIQNWCRANKKIMAPSLSSYAKGRLEMPVRLRVGLGKKPTATPVGKIISNITKPVEEIGEKLLPGFHQGLILWYPKGTRISVHRDAPAYALIKGKSQGLAAQINVIGNCIFRISNCQSADNLEEFQIGEGDCFQFDNKQPHGIDYVQQERCCICFFYLKPEVLNCTEVKQLSLFETEKPVETLPHALFYYDDDNDDIEGWDKRFSVSSTTIKTHNHWDINWNPTVGMKVFIALDKKVGEITKITEENTACSGLTGVKVSCSDGSIEDVYAHHCTPINEVEV
ncbi:hypothetical protein [Kamptonema sp. UHCC 0994]|uniref:hypothetical protein n=1 Tax=Kamptonema sp. UHCC 0994 TaxID=3031329 RepID=UPI0023BA2CDE|nr:hypothetical protein [Kamptonema sp. UHCC 0994]MDF0554894.1 hypothetical protein [Kamptonema sp. UHCC 0994]